MGCKQTCVPTLFIKSTKEYGHVRNIRKRNEASCLHCIVGGGDRGAEARENRGREGYGRRERKGREAGVLRGRAAGEKYETLIFFIQQCVRILSKTRTQNIRANYNAGLD